MFIYETHGSFEQMWQSSIDTYCTALRHKDNSFGIHMLWVNTAMARLQYILSFSFQIKIGHTLKHTHSHPQKRDYSIVCIEHSLKCFCVHARAHVRVCVHHMLVFVSVSVIHLLRSVYMFLLQWWLGMKQRCVILKRDWKNRCVATDRLYIYIYIVIYFNTYIVLIFMMGINMVKVKISVFWNVMWCNLNRTAWKHKFHLIFGRDASKESDEIIFASEKEEMTGGCMKLHNKSVH
jgi:hypothetical protein